MKKLIRKYLGIDKDKEDAQRAVNLVCKAIDEIFDLKKKDMSIRGKIRLIITRELDKAWHNNNYPEAER